MNRIWLAVLVLAVVMSLADANWAAAIGWGVAALLEWERGSWESNSRKLASK